MFIQPQPGPGDPTERFNWDAPILVSPHKPTRLYFASQRVWKSENRGDSWEAVSGDLTRDQERLALPIMGGQQSWDNAWDVGAMSVYNTITSLSESPVQEGLLYAGTDDGILQVSEDGGANWRKIELGSIKGVPATPFVNDVRADLYDAGTVYLVLDNHKYGDYKPYMLKSTDRGRTWQFINGNLPSTLLTWRIVQDHKEKNLLFAATEFGVYVTRDGGRNWTQLKGGIPTIAVRDITIQRKEDDLVAATFGRGFYVLDDLSPLRDTSVPGNSAEAVLFDVKPAWWYVPTDEIYGQGNAEYAAKNPPFGAVFTYYLKDSIPSLKSQRKMAEKNATNVPFPGWDALEAETRQQPPAILFVVKDAGGNVVNTVKGKNKKGYNRVNWPLDIADRSGEPLKAPKPEEDDGFGWFIKATPGDYNVTMVKVVDGVEEVLSGPKQFKVVPLSKGALPGKSYEEIIAFREGFEAFQQELTSTQDVLEESLETVDAMQRALRKAPSQPEELVSRLHQARETLLDIDMKLNGNKAKNEIGERNDPSPGNLGFVGTAALATSTYGPTATHKNALNTARGMLRAAKSELQAVVSGTLPQLASDLKAAGAPWIEGQGLFNRD